MDIHAYIGASSADAADKVIDTLLDLGNALEIFPERYTREPALKDAPLVFRFIPKWNYKIIYTIDGVKGQVIIARVFNTSQDPDKLSV